MKIFYEGRVEPGHIDNLGHMNVRIYAMKAATATRSLMAALGVDKARLAESGAGLAIVDTHTRFYREQLEGAPLAVRGGSLEATPDAITLYLELFNQATGDLSATFRNVVTLQSRPDHRPVPFPTETVAGAESLKVDWPEHGRPRSISLDPITPRFTLAQMKDWGIPNRFRSVHLTPDDCDADGYLDLSLGRSIAFMSLPLRSERHAESINTNGVGIATVESRQVIFNAARGDEKLVSHSTCATLTDKFVEFHDWTFEAGTGTPAAMMITAGLGFNIEARKSAAFPPAMRAKLETLIRPELT